MFGIDWLTANRAVWDFYHARIWLGNEQYPLISCRSEGKWCRKVVLQGNTTIPARSEADVQTKVVCRSWKDYSHDAHWGTEPTTVTQGVYVSRTLVPSDRMHDVTVRVVNVSSRPATFAAGTTVSDLQPLTVIGPLQLSPVDNTTRVASVAEEIPSFIRPLIEGVDPSLPEGAVLSLKELLIANKDAFSQSDTDLGLTKVIAHKIDTGDAKPFRQPLRRFPPAHVEAITQHVDSMLQQGIIEPACSRGPPT